MRLLRPDKLVPATSAYVAITLGPEFTEPPPFDLAGSFAEASVTSPLVFILSPGSDPTGVIIKFAEDRGAAGRLATISMGQG